MSQAEPYVPDDPFSAAAWRVALVDELPDDQMGYSEAWLEWLAARNRLNERLEEAKVADGEVPSFQVQALELVQPGELSYVREVVARTLEVNKSAEGCNVGQGVVAERRRGEVEISQARERGGR